MFRQISWIPLWALLLGLGVPANAQQPNKVSRVGYLAAVSAAADAPRLKAFRQGLLDLGHIDGQNIIIEYRHEAGGFERLPALAADRDRGTPRGATPPPPPGIRVRTTAVRPG